MRLIFSTVPSSLETLSHERAHESTVYLRRQPREGFHRSEELHAYLQKRFPERGLSRGRDRPLYEVDDACLYRAAPGEVLTHRSHVSQ